MDRITVDGQRRRPRRLGADKGYDSDALRAALRQRRIIPCLAVRAKHTPTLTERERRQQRYCRNRWRIERAFAWLNANRRIDRLLERKIKAYAMFLELACVRHYLKILVLT